ncbi:hypothetical protein Acor_25460 [Acrocarpospora corrugata]|uniref:Uncharacterized protein n=1 Tax=Acrocarpospora corrugata TaxID=35763 RepID=A0A5M3VXN7_9ACTN|nr:hypothetical protein [Acrocarpospora corrugata]GES00482.1 hypothetical protein Acor_25460 [Acrocarpospora corrugata]
MRGQDPGSEHDYDRSGPAASAVPPPSFGQAGRGDDLQLGMGSPWRPGYSWFSAPTREDELWSPSVIEPARTVAEAAPPVVPCAPPWQPPPAYTAAAAGMPVWPGANDAADQPVWPAATGESVGGAGDMSDMGDPAGWPPPSAPEPDPAEAPRSGLPPLPAWPANTAEQAETLNATVQSETLKAGMRAETFNAAVQAEAQPAEVPREPVRSGEPGDVPVWPPRLPGEAVYSEDVTGDDPPVVPRHWPPTESPAPTLRPWSAPGRLPAAETEVPEPSAPESWPSAAGASSEAATTEPAEPAAEAPEGTVEQQWPAFGSWPSVPQVSRDDEPPQDAESHEVVPETSAGVPQDESPADRDLVTLPGDRESGLTWPAERAVSAVPEPAEPAVAALDAPAGGPATEPGDDPDAWPPGPGRWRTVVPTQPPPEESIAETTIPRREVMFPVTDAPPPLRRIHGRHTPAEGIVLPPVPQQQQLQRQLPPQAAPAEPRQSGGGRKAVLALCSLIVVGAIGTAAYFAYTDKGDPAATGQAPAVAGAPAVANEGPDPAPTTGDVLDSETSDPRKLTLAEAFPDARISVDGRTFRRVKVNITDKCEDAAAGAFATALTQQQCRRVLRATYVDARKQYAVTTGIAVLPTKEAALEVDKTKNLGGNLWFRGLDGEADTGADRVSISGGYAAGMVWGRYIVFSYATYADGHTPVEKEKDLGPVSGAFRDHTAEVIEKRIGG